MKNTNVMLSREKCTRVNIFTVLSDAARRSLSRYREKPRAESRGADGIGGARFRERSRSRDRCRKDQGRFSRFATRTHPNTSRPLLCISFFLRGCVERKGALRAARVLPFYCRAATRVNACASRLVRRHKSSINNVC